MNQDIRDFMLMGLSYEDACEQARLKDESKALYRCIDPPKGKRHKSSHPFLGAPHMPADMIPCTDHQGQHFENDRAMCKHWDVDLQMYRSRKAHGWGTEEALATPPTECWFKKCVRKMSAQQAAKVGQAIKMFNKLVKDKK